MTLIRRLKQWLVADRVRVSSETGHWLTLQVGQRVIWDDRLWKIDRRQVIDGTQPVGVSYHLVELADDMPFNLRERPPVICDDSSVVVRPQAEHTIRIDCFCEYD